MKAYELTFMDFERGKIRRWVSNKRDAMTMKRKMEKNFEMRKLLDLKPVIVPDNKRDLLAWLNDNCGGDS